VAQQYGKWKMVRPLDRGGQAHTYLVVEEGIENGEQFVLKRLGVDRLDRARTELRAIEELSHPNVVKLKDHDLEGRKPYIVMEYCPGGSLQDANILGYPLLQRLRIFSAICRGVGHAHSHTPAITHRDIKPDNICLREDKITPVVIDFGLCFYHEGERITLIEDKAIGSRMYIAPELAHGFADEEDVSPRADVYSLGKVLYWICAGKIFDRELHHHPRFDLTKEQTVPDMFFIYDLFDETIVEDPSKRLTDANEVAEAVGSIIKRIEMDAHHIDLTTPQACNYCGVGFYKKVIDSPPGKQSAQDHMYGMGINISTSNHYWMLLVCDHCGNVQWFRPDYAKDKNIWTRRSV
jgi:serine/threonine protein kinase